MILDNNGAQQQITQSMNAMLLLNASCQAIVETYINPSSSPWYQEVANELGEAQDLVRDWRESGFLYFSQDVLAGTINCGNAVLSTKSAIESLLDQLSKNYSDIIKQTLVSELSSLTPQILALDTSITSYESKLRDWSIKISVVQDELSKTVANIQAQEGDIQADIKSTNDQITSMQATIETDRQAIAKAKSQETTGIIETIFGVVFAPLTGGASLILAGIGVASIAEAEIAVSALQGSIQTARDQIVSDQAHLTDDQKQIASLQGIVASASLVLSDVAFIGVSLDSLRITWEALNQELTAVITKIKNATTSDVIILQKIWFEAACIEWTSIIQFAQTLQNSPIRTKTVTIQ